MPLHFSKSGLGANARLCHVFPTQPETYQMNPEKSLVVASHPPALQGRFLRRGDILWLLSFHILSPQEGAVLLLSRNGKVRGWEQRFPVSTKQGESAAGLTAWRLYSIKSLIISCQGTDKFGLHDSTALLEGISDWAFWECQCRLWKWLQKKQKCTSAIQRQGSKGRTMVEEEGDECRQ